jgi:hypothetical protein
VIAENGLGGVLPLFPIVVDVSAATNVTRLTKSSIPDSGLLSLSKADRRATVMAIVLCSMSMVTHFVAIAANLYAQVVPTGLVASYLLSQIYAYAACMCFFLFCMIQFWAN